MLPTAHLGGGLACGVGHEELAELLAEAFGQSAKLPRKALVLELVGYVSRRSARFDASIPQGGLVEGDIGNEWKYHPLINAVSFGLQQQPLHVQRIGRVPTQVKQRVHPEMHMVVDACHETVSVVPFAAESSAAVKRR